jgi:uncharacterized Zn-binding protein involved in type VI secretion
MKPAARVTDMHTCPQVNPGTPPVPHVGGPILPAGCPTVLIGNLPAARQTDLCVCVGPLDSISMGSPTVLIGNLPAARLGDPTVHGGVIVCGWPTVLIGESGGTSTPTASAASSSCGCGAAASQAATMMMAKLTGAPFTCLDCEKKA